MATDPFVLDRLIALKHSFGDIGREPFNIRDDRSCAYRVVSNLVMRGQMAEATEREGRALYRSLLERYATAGLDPTSREAIGDLLADPDASAASLSALAGRCLGEADWRDPALAALNRETARAQVDLLGRMERRYRALVDEEPPTIGGGDAPIVDFVALAKELDGDPSTELCPLHIINGGYSKVTIVCELRIAGQAARKLVVRSDAGLAFAGTSVLDEYPVIQAMHAAGVAVPRPLWAGRTAADALPALVVEFSEGQPFGSPVTAALRSDSLCRDMGRHLARIHAVDPALLGAIEGDPAEFNRAAVARELDAKAAQTRAIGQPMPLLDYALAWLRNNLAAIGGRITIVHGDYAPHNLLAVGEEVRGVLDWEFVKLGHPAEDMCFGRLAIEALGEWDTFLAAYVAEGGTRPAEEELHFYTILSLYRLCVMIMQTDAAIADSDIKAIRMVAPGAERLRPSLLKLAARLGLDVTDPGGEGEGGADHAG